MIRRLQFHRGFLGYTGGHGKVFDYFCHARAHPGWAPSVHFSAGRDHPDNPWRGMAPGPDDTWRPSEADALFLAGMDWLQYPADLGMPVVNLVQHVRHADPGADVHPFLSRPAIRICVSQAVADAIAATGRVNGPVRVIEAGIGSLPGSASARGGVFIAALKQPQLGRELAGALLAEGRQADLCDAWIPRADFLARLARSEVAVMLPFPSEGFFLPGLEAMALGAAAVVPDCAGNRAYLRDGVNALVPALELGALHRAVRMLDDRGLRDRLVANGSRTAERFTLEAERAAFHRILDDLEGLWTGTSR